MHIFRQSVLCDIGDECLLPYVLRFGYYLAPGCIHYDIKDKATED